VERLEPTRQHGLGLLRFVEVREGDLQHLAVNLVHARGILRPMSEAVKIAVIAAIPAVLAAIGSILGLLVGRRNTHKIDVVHTLVNSQMTAVRAELCVAEQKIVDLQEFILDQRRRAEAERRE
jgi:hypothetical protein